MPYFTDTVHLCVSYDWHNQEGTFRSTTFSRLSSLWRLLCFLSNGKQSL